VHHRPKKSAVLPLATSRIQAERDLATSETHLREILNAIADPVFVKDREHRWTLLNDACCAFIGHRREDLLGKSDYEFFPPEQARVFWEKDESVFTTGRGNVNEEYFTDASGLRHTILTKKTLYRDPLGHPYIVGIIRDITDQKTAEAALRQKDKELYQVRRLEAVGRLAGGVAHDFNNLMTGILGLCEDLRGTVPADDKRQDAFGEIRKAIERAFSVTRQLLAFGGRQPVHQEVLNINDCIRDFHRMLQRLIGENVSLQLHLGDVPLIEIDRGNIEQIIMNLVLNARDAVRAGGQIILCTRTAHLARRHPGLLNAHPGRYAHLTVRDNGSGMSEQTVSKVFEPFFTTKSKEKGTGLGLSTVYGIVQRVGGDLHVSSRLGEGSSFDIFFPAYTGPAESPGRKDRPDAGHQSHGTILVAEDEDIVRKVVSQRLIRAGYRVLQASNGEEALSLFEKAGHVDLVLTDVVMPRLNGRELADRIHERSPKTKVLFMSGYPDDIIAHHGLLEPGIHFIEKSKVVESLEERIREMLNLP
jgi:PAS domain S-box-containing protein